MPNGMRMVVRRYDFLMNVSADYIAGTGWLVGFPGDTAHDCLQSMPFRTDLALQFLNQYWSYLQFHSTIDTLKSKYWIFSACGNLHLISVKIQALATFRQEWICSKVTTGSGEK